MHNLSKTELVRKYVDLGWEPIMLPAKQKRPNYEWGEPRSWSREDVEDAFSGSSNVGIALGGRSGGLIDLDLDCPEAVHFSENLLGHLPSFGRKGSPSSHRLVKCTTTKNRWAFSLLGSLKERVGKDRSTLLEIRSSNHQTMFPPSIHPSGETVEWESRFEDIPQMEQTELLKRCGLLAALCVFAKFYPREAGERDEICMMLASTLLQAGHLPEDVDRMVMGIASYAQDEEATKRGGKALQSQQRKQEGKSTWGLPELCKRLGIEEQESKLREWLGMESFGMVDDGRPTIMVEPGKKHLEVDQAEAALLASDIGVYQRGDSLVRVVTLPKSSVDFGISRSGGVILVREVKKPWLLEKFGIVANWGRRNKKKAVPIDPPHGHADTLLAREGEWNAPVLTGIVATPTLRGDMTLIQKPGYDETTGLLYDPGDIQFPEIPDQPTKEDARAALETILNPFREFVFAGREDRSVLLAAILTSVVRRILPSAPLFAIDAPTAGSGKSLMVELIGIIATGHKPAMMSQGKSPEEDEKRLSSVLMAGDAIIVIDNCDRALGGDTLCTILTQEVFRARVLGKSETPQLLTNVLVMATGNNLTIAGDLGRRTLICRIDTGEERPDQIRHTFNAQEEVLRDRPKLVAAALTILIAYVKSGAKVDVPPMGSFERWDFIREAIVWLGESDPWLTQRRITADDPRKNELVELLQLWREALGDETVTIAEIGKRAGNASGNPVALLQDMLAEMTYNRTFNAKSIGRVLMRHKDTVAGGLVLRAIDDPSKAKRYMVEKLSPSPDEDVPF